ncbi:MAG: nickel pincer cofactor biosynthesis protein LarC [Planctomycetaceae bacterium]|nr:nickel pincer cofactor biosynthesis protein LarC [Planctomycetaceae bacterium]
MKTIYLDCASGISGDMMLGALVDLGVDLAAIQTGVDSLGLPSCQLKCEEVKRHAFRASHVKVVHEPEHAHRHLHHITEMIARSSLSDAAQELATRIFTRLGEAEAKVHGTTIEKVHFHEVGAVDSIADIVGAAIGISMIGAERIVCSPIPTGTGFIEIAHGRCSLPAPATAELLRGIPLVELEVPFELTTPTGAAIVASVATSFGGLPDMAIESIGYGAGSRDLKSQANLLRMIVGQPSTLTPRDRIVVLETNLDDVTGEILGYCTQRLMEAGALDVFTTAIQMKKNRPGTQLSVLCAADQVVELEAIVFQETRTLGIRRWQADRHLLEREPCDLQTPLGPIRAKKITLSDGSVCFSPEFEDCQRIAREKQIPLQQVLDVAKHEQMR